MNKDSK